MHIRRSEVWHPPRCTRATRKRYNWDRNFCTCGWPYHLLLLRGTPEGMPARLLVVITD